MTGKETLRRELREKRVALADREKKDEAVFRAVTALAEYREAHELLCYVSTGEEADTRRLLARALADGKAVFAPVCLAGDRLAFHRIQGLEDLIPARFGLLEPDPARCPVWRPGGKALCIVPGLAFDRRGYRLGYGKGYYDRFLAEFRLPAAGLCYRELMLPPLPVQAHDRPVDLLVTEEGVFPCGRATEKEGGPTP